MNVLDAAKALNQRAMREHWYHLCDPSLVFSDPVYEKLLQLWHTKADGHAMPRRSALTARDLKDVLRHILVLERISQNPSRYKFRLVGTGLHQLAGEWTGKLVEELVPPEHMPRWIECGDLVLNGGQPMRFIGRVHLKGKEYLNAENLYVPLANDNGEPTFVMGLCRYTPRRSENEESWESQAASISAGLM